MFIIAVNSFLSIRTTREGAAEVAITAVQKEIDDYQQQQGKDAWAMAELEEAIAILKRWCNRELTDGYVKTESHRVFVKLNDYVPGLQIEARYLISGMMNILIQPETA